MNQSIKVLIFIQSILLFQNILIAEMTIKSLSKTPLNQYYNDTISPEKHLKYLEKEIKSIEENMELSQREIIEHQQSLQNIDDEGIKQLMKARENYHEDEKLLQLLKEKKDRILEEKKDKKRLETKNIDTQQLKLKLLIIKIEKIKKIIKEEQEKMNSYNEDDLSDDAIKIYLEARDTRDKAINYLKLLEKELNKTI